MSQAIIAVLAVLLATGTAKAQWFWTGLGGAGNDFNNLDDPANWFGFVAPPLDLGGASLIFDTDILLNPLGNLPDVEDNHYVNVGFIIFDPGAALWSYGIHDGGWDTPADPKGGSFQFVDGGGILNNTALFHFVAVNLIGTGDRMYIIDQGQLSVFGSIDLSHTMGVQLVVGGNGQTTLAGTIGGAGGSVLKQDAGTLILTGANTYTAGTELFEGTLLIGGNSALGTGPLLVTGDSGLGASGVASAANDVFLFAELTILGADNLTLSGGVHGGGSLVMDFDADNDVLTLSGSNTYSGGTTLTQGTLVLGSNSAL
ncbi:MAG: autotransporter-associated beta strand repeat-containing protein, partial [Planctomycetota bacterium]